MKIKRLFLQAFGPFTDKEMNFSGYDGKSAANLHLIYGANEAGKSSALRAITDLRFGIPARSSDSFIHDNNKLRIAGEFETEHGESISLVRRKGNKNTLSIRDNQDASVSREHELALSDGLRRDEFEAMFGLNHQRLRSGGARLLKGEGELGTALFEASTGIQGITEVLTELEAEAKKYYAPHASTSVILSAKKELEQQRRFWKKSIAKPAEWQQRNKAHEKAKEALEDIEQALEDMRRKDNQLTELRTVAPLLENYDRALDSLQALDDAPDLPSNAREERLAAEQALLHAQNQHSTSKDEQKKCQKALAKLTIEVCLLEHQGEIERLTAKVDSVQQSLVDAQKQQSVIEYEQDKLHSQANRIATGKHIHDIAAITLSESESADLKHHLDELNLLESKYQILTEQMNSTMVEPSSGQGDVFQAPDKAIRQALLTALQQAQSLGDTVKRRRELNRAAMNSSNQLKSALSNLAIAPDSKHDLGKDGKKKLLAMQPLLDADILSAQKQYAAMEDRANKLQNEASSLQKTLEKEVFEQDLLRSDGELVTFESLHLIREKRDGRWASLRQIIEGKQVGQLDASLPDLFEFEQKEADRFADILRSDASRAGQYDACSSNITTIKKRQATFKQERESLLLDRQTMADAWHQKLHKAGLPELSPQALAEWQKGRNKALDIWDHLTEQQCNESQFIADETSAQSALIAALHAVEEVSPKKMTLSSLIDAAALWEKATTESIAEQRVQRKDAARRKVEAEKLMMGVEETESSIAKHNSAIKNYCESLFLKPDSTTVAVKARLEELEALHQKTRSLHEMKMCQQQIQGLIALFKQQVGALANLLNEPAPDVATDFISRIHNRLHESQQQQQDQKNLIQGLERAEKHLAESKQGMKEQADILQCLCRAARVDDVEKLAAQEDKAAKKRQTKSQAENLKQQLLQASTHSEEALRLQLSAQDVVSIEAERERCQLEIARLKQGQKSAQQTEEKTRRALEEIDASDAAATAREAMESAVARYRAAIRPWARLKLARSLLQRALNQFKEQSQAPMVKAASVYFSLITAGRYPRLLADETENNPVLIAERQDGESIRIEAMSEGTADQLYLALRLASLEIRRHGTTQMPLILDDVLITSDDDRSTNVLKALAKFSEGGQVLLFTHHHHLLDLAAHALSDKELLIHKL